MAISDIMLTGIGATHDNGLGLFNSWVLFLHFLALLDVGLKGASEVRSGIVL